jgi:hypothetical protein
LPLLSAEWRSSKETRKGSCPRTAHIYQARFVGVSTGNQPTVSFLAQPRQELFHALDSIAPLILCYVSLQLVVFEVGQGFHHEAGP